jgi:hypothetical protein
MIMWLAFLCGYARRAAVRHAGLWLRQADHQGRWYIYIYIYIYKKNEKIVKSSRNAGWPRTGTYCIKLNFRWHQPLDVRTKAHVRTPVLHQIKFSLTPASGCPHKSTCPDARTTFVVASVEKTALAAPSPWPPPLSLRDHESGRPYARRSFPLTPSSISGRARPESWHEDEHAPSPSA